MSDNTIELLEKKVDKLLYWRNGNGTKGAAMMIGEHEKKINELELHHAAEKQIFHEVVINALKERGKTVEGFIRAFGPYVAAAAAIIITVMEK